MKQRHQPTLTETPESLLRCSGTRPCPRLLLVLTLAGLTLPVLAQKQPRQPAAKAASVQQDRRTGALPAHAQSRQDLMKRLSRIIEELKRQGPPQAGCMEG